MKRSDIATRAAMRAFASMGRRLPHLPFEKLEEAHRLLCAMTRAIEGRVRKENAEMELRLHAHTLGALTREAAEQMIAPSKQLTDGGGDL